MRKLFAYVRYFNECFLRTLGTIVFEKTFETTRNLMKFDTVRSLHCQVHPYEEKVFWYLPFCQACIITMFKNKVVIEKSRGEVFLIEQDTVDFFSLIFEKFLLKLHFYNVFDCLIYFFFAN